MQAFKYIGYVVIGVSIIVLVTKYALATKTKEALDSNSIEGTLQVV